MVLDAVLSVATLAGLLWAGRYLLPRALKEHDRFALVCAILTAALMLVLWLLIGVARVS
jgi:hypothetical protein